MRLRTSRVMIVILPCMLLLSGCAGVGNYVGSVANPFSVPNASTAETLNMQRARGTHVVVQPISPEAGNVWPSPAKPVPTLGQMQKNIDLSSGQRSSNQYQPLRSRPPSASNAFGGTTVRVPTIPHSREKGPDTVALPVGQTLLGPKGPVGIVTSPSNGRYQEVAPINGKGGGILIRSGAGSATLIEPGGQVVIVHVPIQ